MNIKLNFEGIGDYSHDSYNNEVFAAHESLNQHNGAGSDFLGWLRYEAAFDRGTLDQIKKVSKEISSQADVLLVLGIGGSYLGASAFISALSRYFERSPVEIIFAGNDLDGEYLSELLSYIKGKSVYVNVISKSGTTLETALAFRTIKKYMRDNFEEDFSQRIIATTDSSEGTLRKYADEHKMRSFVIPNDIGGRYSVFTPAGLLPMAVAGINIDEVMEGLKTSIDDFNKVSIDENPAYQYALIRQYLYSKNKKIEIFVNHKKKLRGLAEWFKQLFGESEGKEGKGIYPSSAIFSTDLHSLGQMIQEGERNIFETFLIVKESATQLIINEDAENPEKLNDLSNRSYDDIDHVMLNAVKKAHLSGDVPCISIEIESLNAFNLAYLMYFFMKACAMSGYLQKVNPFDQPGVEAYKTNMREFMKKQE